MSRSTSTPWLTATPSDRTALGLRAARLVTGVPFAACFKVAAGAECGAPKLATVALVALSSTSSVAGRYAGAARKAWTAASVRVELPTVAKATGTLMLMEMIAGRTPRQGRHASVQ